ncbi:HD-GYP domain-containing protein [Candidatus Nitrospira nitrificans]|uniref:Putative Metal-dependent phosphohydrolase n=1 Tax=Candidatus Nitrospira nitrificans TaxID=1742973 RepID=A0A0S4L4C4_9BACT|nr:HD-GYP domain-containing protein [Candidatus Nitrospira nitrificans]CUS31550.1 putative Metal-dependent phosphohydrolase [Candidatus Nitrospira nitrificans]
MATKRIPIEQVIPGMFITEMDIPWYQSPFLSHKRLIKDLQTIQLMKQHGIRTVTIDTDKGTDLPPEASTTMRHAANRQSPDSDAPVLPDPAPKRAPEAKSDDPSVAVIYTQAQETVERIFEDLERGIPPSPEATKAIVSNVLSQVLSNRAAMATQIAIQKIKQFDRSLTTHALDTCILSLVVAIESELDQPAQELVGMGALLHDAGYVRLPRNLVRKREECSKQDKTLLEQHCKLGVALLSEHPGMHEDVMRIVREHHERADGSGFPAGLGNGQISRLAQIVGIVDFYDGMVTRRGTRPAMIPHDAVRQLFLAGEQGLFEKSLVELMIRSIGVYPVGSLVRLNTGEQAVVVGVNPQQRLKPLIRVTTDPQGGVYATPIDIDLATPSSGHTVRTVLRVLDPARERVNIGIHLDQDLSRAA